MELNKEFKSGLPVSASLTNEAGYRDVWLGKHYVVTDVGGVFIEMRSTFADIVSSERKRLARQVALSEITEDVFLYKEYDNGEFLNVKLPDKINASVLARTMYANLLKESSSKVRFMLLLHPKYDSVHPLDEITFAERFSNIIASSCSILEETLNEPTVANEIINPNIAVSLCVLIRRPILNRSEYALSFPLRIERVLGKASFRLPGNENEVLAFQGTVELTAEPLQGETNEEEK